MVLEPRDTDRGHRRLKLHAGGYSPLLIPQSTECRQRQPTWSVRCADVGQPCCDTAAQEMKRVSLRRSLSLRVGSGKTQKATAESALPSTGEGSSGSSSGQAHGQRLGRETQGAAAQRQQQPAKTGITIDAGGVDSDGRCEDEKGCFVEIPALIFLLLLLLRCVSPK